MKKNILLFLIIVLIATSVSAQIPKPITLYVGGGITKPTAMEYLDEYWKSGYNLNAGIGLNFLPMFQTVIKAQYHQIPLDKDELGITSSIELPDFHAVTIGLEGRFSMSNSVTQLKPYLFGGVGVAIITFSAFDAGFLEGTGITSPTLEDANKFYYSFGGGLELKSFPLISIYAQIEMIQIATEFETTQLIPFTVGVKF